MKIILAFGVLLIFGNVNAQQSFRINDFPRVFKGSISNTFDKKISDTVTMHGVYKSPNYQISLVSESGSVLCSCLYSLSGVTETSNAKDSTIQTKVLIPVIDNCLKKYRTLVDRKLQ